MRTLKLGLDGLHGSVYSNRGFTSNYGSLIPATRICYNHVLLSRNSEHLKVCRAQDDDGISKVVDKLALENTSSRTSELTLGGAPLQLSPGTVLADKYTITKILGMGGSAITYQATSPDGSTVAVKALSLKAAKDWKQLTLFQREAQTLAALNHPGIPKYLDYFEVDTEDDRAFYLVQQEVAGKTMAQLLQEGSRCSTEQATTIATQLCQVLDYLSSLHPPVVHRDVKPENVVLAGGSWSGAAYLVDFGGVAAVASSQDAGAFASTIVGTYGYMAPEQFRGSAQPASDMFGLGATLLTLLSGQPPFAFPQERMRIQWRGTRDGTGPSFQAPSGRWEALLDGMLEPIPEDRITAKQALDILEGRLGSAMSKKQPGTVRPRVTAAASPLSPPMSPAEARMMAMSKQLSGMNGVPSGPVKQPAGSRVVLDRSPNRLDITIPPKGLLNSDTLGTGAFAVAWNAFVAFWTVGALAGGGILFALFSLPFWFAGVQLGKQAFGSALMKERFAIGRSKFRLGQELALLGKDGQADFLGGKNEKVLEGSVEDLQGARLVTTMFVNDQPQTAIELIEGVRKHRWGEGLDITEQQWLVQQINDHLESMRGQQIDYEAFPPIDMPKVVRDNYRFDD